MFIEYLVTSEDENEAEVMIVAAGIDQEVAIAAVDDHALGLALSHASVNDQDIKKNQIGSGQKHVLSVQFLRHHRAR